MKSFITSDDLNLAYDDAGDGIPVLCLAGLTRNSADFDDFASVCGDNIRLIRMDYRGRGRSDYDPNYVNYSIPVEARDAVELLDYLDIDKAVIVGTSRGGLISMILAATVKERLAGVLLNDIGPVVEADGIAGIMTHLGRHPDFKTYRDAARMLPIMNAPVFGDVPDGRWLEFAKRIWVETPRGLNIRYDPNLRKAIQEASLQPTPDLWPIFDALSDVPLALVRGANSNILSFGTASEMNRRIPDMIWKEVPDRGHVPFLDEPECQAAFRELMDMVAI